MTQDSPEAAVSADAILKAQQRRNIWLAVALIAFVAIVGVSTAIRIQQVDFSNGDRLYFSGYLDEAASEQADREAQARIAARQAAEAEAVQAAEPVDE